MAGDVCIKHFCGFCEPAVQFGAANSGPDGRATVDNAFFASFSYEPDFSIIDKGRQHVLEHVGLQSELEKLVRGRAAEMQSDLDAFFFGVKASPEETVAAYVDHFTSAVRVISSRLVDAAVVAKTYVHKDAFGSYVFDRFERQMADLLSRSFPQLGAIDRQAEILTVCMATIGLADALGMLSSAGRALSNEVGEAYELECEDSLKAAGFATLLTPATNDHGADIIATKNNLKFAIQCKKYATPVGNGAVREVAAAKIRYECDYAVLCSESGYTDSAFEAARKLSVMLMARDNLKDILQMV